MRSHLLVFGVVLYHNSMYYFIIELRIYALLEDDTLHNDVSMSPSTCGLGKLSTTKVCFICEQLHDCRPAKG